MSRSIHTLTTAVSQGHSPCSWRPPHAPKTWLHLVSSSPDRGLQGSGAPAGSGPKHYLSPSIWRPLASAVPSPPVRLQYSHSAGYLSSSLPSLLRCHRPGFLLYAAAVQSSCTHYIFSSGPRRVLIIFLRRTLCYLSPWHLQRWAAQACPQPIDWWDYTLPCSIGFPCPLHWLAVQQWSYVCSIRHNLYLFCSKFWRMHANF